MNLSALCDSPVNFVPGGEALLVALHKLCEFLRLMKRPFVWKEPAEWASSIPRACGRGYNPAVEA